MRAQKWGMKYFGWSVDTHLATSGGRLHVEDGHPAQPT